MLIRGKEYQVNFTSEPSGLVMVVVALLALEDSRVDAVLSAARVQLFDVDGLLIWPQGDDKVVNAQSTDEETS